MASDLFDTQLDPLLDLQRRMESTHQEMARQFQLARDEPWSAYEPDEITALCVNDRTFGERALLPIGQIQTLDHTYQWGWAWRNPAEREVVHYCAWKQGHPPTHAAGLTLQTGGTDKPIVRVRADGNVEPDNIYMMSLLFTEPPRVEADPLLSLEGTKMAPTSWGCHPRIEALADLEASPTRTFIHPDQYACLAHRQRDDPRVSSPPSSSEAPPVTFHPATWRRYDHLSPHLDEDRNASLLWLVLARERRDL